MKDQPGGKPSIVVDGPGGLERHRRWFRGSSRSPTPMPLHFWPVCELAVDLPAL